MATITPTAELVAPSLRAHLDRLTATLTTLEVGDGAWVISSAPDLARSFTLLLRRSDRTNSFAFGRDQKVTSVEVAADGRSASIEWGPVIADDGAEHDIRLTGGVRVEGDGLVWTMTVDNRSAVVVENVLWPQLADIRPSEPTTSVASFCYQYATARRRRLWPHFDNVYGYFGVERPTMINEPTPGVGNPTAPFILLEAGSTGLYVGVDAGVQDLVVWHAELEPGYGESISSCAPRGDTVGDKPVAVHFDVAHLPYVAPGEERSLAPIRLEGYTGDWHQGADVYIRRRRTWQQDAPLPDWTADVHAWQQVQLNSPEDERRYTFADLPAIAKECADRGVKAIQVVGWNEGGQDQNNPSHTPDPNLGGAQALAEAVAACHDLGVRVVLFTKFTWADRATDRFRKELVGSAIKDPYGDYYMHPGYRYRTITQLLDINTKRLVPMCFADPAYVGVCEEEFAKVLATGADGMLFDECLHHGPALLCFDEAHGHRYAEPAYGHDVELADRLRQVADGANPDFLFAGEACYDGEFAAYQLSYHRSESVEHIPLMRYLRPHSPLMTAATGFDDRNMVNQCLLYRYVLSYEPYNFKGRLPDMPLTVEYGRKMDAARAELRDWFWDGTFQDTVGASVRNARTGAAHHPYAVFRRAGSDELGIVVANYDLDEAVDVVIDLDRQAGSYVARSVDDPTWTSVADTLTVPPRSALMVIPG